MPLFAYKKQEKSDTPGNTWIPLATGKQARARALTARWETYALCRILPQLIAHTADPLGELNVLWHDGDTLGVDGAEVSILKQAHKKRLRTLL